ncbi:MAG: PAS domain S-box protein, partial [Desulfomonilaceae bacterium]
MEKELHGRPKRRGWVALFVAITLAILILGYLYYTHETERIRQAKYDEIATIAKLKAGSIENRRKELLRDVQALSAGPLWKRAVNEWLHKPDNDALLKDLRGQLVVEQRQGAHADALLLDLNGNVIVSASDQSEPTDTIEKKAVEEALASGSPVLSDMYRTPHGAILMDAVAPILDPNGRSIAIVIYRANPQSLLFPLIQTWPTPSQTAETLLVRRDGDDVLFLNDLRHRANTALSLREPLTLNDLPAVQAVLGKKGLFEGKDYRGVEVLADLRPIPDSTWFMVTKVDTSEILAEARYRGVVVTIFSGLFILLAAGLTAYGYSNRQARLYENLFQSERDQRKAEELFRTTLYSIGDAVITTDAKGLVQQMNPVAERLTGWLEAEATGKTLDEVFHIVQEESRAPVVSPVQRVLSEGTVVGLANHTVLISRDGTERPVADSGAPIRSEDGSILGVVLVFRDQTEERAAQKALTESEERYRTVADFTYDWEYWIGPEDNLLYVSPSCERITGYSAQQFLDDPGLLMRIVHPDDVNDVMKHFHMERKVDHETFHSLDFQIIHRDGHTLWINHACQPVYGKERQPLGRRACNRDITDRKRAEEQLRESEQKYRSLFEDSTDGIFINEVDGTLVDANQSFFDLFGYTREEILGTSVTRLYANPEDRDRFRQDIEKDGSIKDYPLSLLKKDRTAMDCLLTGTVRKSNDGTILGYRGIIRDVTEQKRTEAALLNEKILTDRMIDSLPGVFYLFNIEGKFLRWNKNFERVSGRSAEEIVAMLPLDFISQEHKLAVEDAIREAFEAGETTVEADFISKDGSKIPHLFTGKQINLGRTRCLVGLGIDTRALKLAEEALKAEKWRFEMLANNSPFGMVIIQPDGSFSYANPKLIEIFGYDLDDVPNGREWLRKAYPDPEYRHEVISTWIKDARGAVPGETRPREFRVVCKDATEKIINFRTVRLQSGEDLMTCEDITDRKRLEEEKETSSFLNTLMNAIPIPLFYKDIDGRYIGFNKSFEELFGKTRQDLVGKNAFDISPVDLAEIYHAKDLELFHNPGAQVYDSQVKDSRGEVHDVVFHKSTFSDPQGHVLGLIGAILDISERKRVLESLRDSEEQLRAVIYGSPIPQFMINQDHRVTHWNHALEAISGIMADQVIGTAQHWKAFYDEPRPTMADLLIDEESYLVPDWYAGKYRKSKFIADAYEATDFFPTLGNDGKWL